ncbi:MAG: T9SS type A sorting domain-containing protein [Rhodothermales bacterium]
MYTLALIRRTSAILLGLWVFFLSPVLLAQSITINNLPTGQIETPLFEAGMAQAYPALAINGFDCNASGHSCNKGLGFKQIIEALASPEENPELRAFFYAIANLAGAPLGTPSTRSIVKQNTLIAESRAFIAVATLILEENGINPSVLDLPAHQEAVSRFQEVFADVTYTQFDKSLSDDAVKWAGPLGSLARTIDFYLSLEQAYLHYGLTLPAFFSCNEKSALLTHLQDQIEIVDALGNTSVMDLSFIRILGIDVASIIRDISYDEVQGGNWPMKVHAAIGYASIVHQRPTTAGCSLFTPSEAYERWLGRALRSAGGPNHENRSHHWAYQTGKGQRFWAEGPFYFNYGLATVLPFWHAARLQDLLNENDDFDIADPFRSDWFLEPLHAFADVVTPEGATPPLEDGNKIPMEAAHLLRWSPAYGDASIGSKFSWIAASHPTLPSADLWMHALALPVNTTFTPPLSEVTTETYPEHPQQMILRRDGQSGSCDKLPADRQRPCHYILINGETTAAIRPGEGHEQSDQLQLLYYVDDTSFLIDGGYDSAPGIQNSTWNAYRNHNVMTADQLSMQGGHGGLPGPIVGLSCTRTTSSAIGEITLPAACMYADHNPVEVWQHSQHGRVDVIEAGISIYPDSPQGNDEVFYERTLFFIDDPDAPYLVDINAAQAKETLAQTDIALTMQYHGNAALSEKEDVQSTAFWRALWAAPDSLGQSPQTGSHDLFIQSFAIESDYVIELKSEITRELSIGGLASGEGLNVEKLSLSNIRADAIAAPSHTTVAFIQPRLSTASTYSNAFVDITNFSEVLPRLWQVFTWQIDTETTDVLFVRAASTDSNPTLEAPLALPSGKWTVDKMYQSPGISFDTNTNVLTLDGETNAGFIRFSSNLSVGNETPSGHQVNLGQNVPNPFSTQTRIHFEIPTAQHVQLEIYDALGRLVTSLFNGIKTAGKHSIDWQPKSLSHGIYFYRLQSESEVLIKQLTLL